MRLPKGKTKFLLLLLALLALLTLVPIPFQVEASSTRVLRLETAYVNSCRKLSDKKLQKQLLEATGVQSPSDKTDPDKTHEMEKTDPPAKNDLLTGGAKIDPITGAYTRSEDFQVQCETEVGVAKLDLRQDTKFSLKELEVLTYSLREDTAVKSYRHAIRLTPNEGCNQRQFGARYSNRSLCSVAMAFHSTFSPREIGRLADGQLCHSLCRIHGKSLAVPAILPCGDAWVIDREKDEMNES